MTGNLLGQLALLYDASFRLGMELKCLSTSQIGFKYAFHPSSSFPTCLTLTPNSTRSRYSSFILIKPGSQFGIKLKADKRSLISRLVSMLHIWKKCHHFTLISKKAFLVKPTEMWICSIMCPAPILSPSFWKIRSIAFWGFWLWNTHATN